MKEQGNEYMKNKQYKQAIDKVGFDHEYYRSRGLTLPYLVYNGNHTGPYKVRLL